MPASVKKNISGEKDKAKKHVETDQPIKNTLAAFVETPRVPEKSGGIAHHWPKKNRLYSILDYSIKSCTIMQCNVT